MHPYRGIAYLSGSYADIWHQLASVIHLCDSQTVILKKYLFRASRTR